MLCVWLITVVQRVRVCARAADEREGSEVLKSIFQRMARHNAWMNDRLYEALAGGPDEERKRDRGALFWSAHGILNHLLLAGKVWMGRFTGRLTLSHWTRRCTAILKNGAPRAVKWTT